MSKGNTGAPYCKICENNHSPRDPHRWLGVGKSPTRRNIVQTLEKKVATITKNVHTIRKVSIRELGRGLSKHFSNLPFEVTKNGRVIARVDKK